MGSIASAKSPPTGASDAAPCGPCATSGECEWVATVACTSHEIEVICNETGAPRELAIHALDVDELARVNHHPSGAILVVMRVPGADDGTETPLRTIALSVILMGDRVVTIAPAALDVVASAALSPPRALRSSAGVLIALVVAIADRYLAHLRAIDAAVSALETKLHATLRNVDLRTVLGHQKTLVHFRIGIASNLIMLERLARDARVFTIPEDRERLDDAMVEMRQAAEMTTVSSAILGEMMAAFASLTSNNLNVVMKVMTALMILIAVPSMIAAFYGMNVALPGQDDARSFMGVVGAAFAAASAIFILFRRARWL